MGRSYLGRNTRRIYGVCAFLVLGVVVSLCHGQITFDGSVGPSGTLDPTMPGGNEFAITGAKGAIIGNNLFHSFGEFNIAAGQIASFSGLDNVTIANILSRVTGGNVSNINGLLRSEIAGANFFLINPAGVIFGAGAQIDVTGSFVVSTADKLHLADGGVFSAIDTDPDNNVLTSAPPSAFGFLDTQPPTEVGVQVNDTTLAVETGQSITIVADDGVDDNGAVAGVQINGGTLTVADDVLMEAASGKISLVSVASAGKVNYDAATHAVDLDATSFAQLGDVELINKALLDPSGRIGGTVTIRGGQLTINNSSAISSNNLSSANGAPIAIDVEVTGQVMMNGATMQVVTTGGRSGDILIAGGSFKAENNSQIQVFTTSSADSNAGNISITATADSVDVLSSSDIFTLTRGNGSAGLVKIKAEKKVDISARSIISANTRGAGDAGLIDISATDLTMNSSGIQAVSLSTGAAGEIMIDADTVDLSNMAQIIVLTLGGGAGGLAKITADTLTLREGSTPSSTSGLTGNIVGGTNGGTAAGGHVQLMVNKLDMNTGGSIRTDTRGSGPAGDITINWKDPMSPTGMITMSGGSTMFAVSRNTGDSGDILINPLAAGQTATGTVALSENAQIVTAASIGRGGNAGDLTINADRIVFDGTNVAGEFTGLDASSDNDGGTGGLITLNAVSEIKLTNGAKIVNSSEGSELGGDVMITAQTLTLESGGRIGAAAEADGDGGDITIYADTVSVSGAGVFVSTEAVGNSNIFSQVLTGATGNSGDIIIAGRMSTVDNKMLAQSVQITDGGNISTTTGGLGTGGDIEVHTMVLGVSEVNPTLQQALIDAGTTDAPQARGGILAGSTASFGGNGDAGDIRVTAGSVAVTDGGVIASSTTSLGAGGDINIQAENLTIATDGFVSSESSTNNGLAGDVIFDVGQDIEILSGGSVRTSSRFGSGADIMMTAGVDLTVIQGTISSAAGINGGDITLTAGVDLTVIQGTISSAAGINGGNIALTANSTDILMNLSTVTALAGNVGGDIKLNAPHFVHLVDSVITAEANNSGGNVDIDPIAVVLNNSRLVARAPQGRGGNVRVIAQAFIVSPLTLNPLDPVIDVTGGIEEGSIEIISPDSDLSGSLVNLPGNLVDDIAQLSASCAIKLEGEFSSFIVVGRGGVPVEPGTGQPSFHLSGRGGQSKRNKAVSE